MSFKDDALTVVDEIRSVVERLEKKPIQPFVDEILRADTIACYGVGREGLMIKSFAMRLMHLGLNAHVVGDMTTPPVGSGDLLVTSAGPGYFSTVNGLMETARNAGARVAIVTAQPGDSMVKKADTILPIPAQTMAEEESGAGGDSIQPMGCTFEQAQLVVFDTLVLQLMESLNESAESMSERHTNLE